MDGTNVGHNVDTNSCNGDWDTEPRKGSATTVDGETRCHAMGKDVKWTMESEGHCNTDKVTVEGQGHCHSEGKTAETRMEGHCHGEGKTAETRMEDQGYCHGQGDVAETRVGGQGHCHGEGEVAETVDKDALCHANSDDTFLKHLDEHQSNGSVKASDYHHLTSTPMPGVSAELNTLKQVKENKIGQNTETAETEDENSSINILAGNTCQLAADISGEEASTSMNENRNNMVIEKSEMSLTDVTDEECSSQKDASFLSISDVLAELDVAAQVKTKEKGQNDSERDSYDLGDDDEMVMSDNVDLQSDLLTTKGSAPLLKAMLPLVTQVANIKKRKRGSSSLDFDRSSCSCKKDGRKGLNGKVHYHCLHCKYYSTMPGVVRHEAMVHHIQHKGFQYFQCPVCDHLLTQVSEYSRHLLRHSNKLEKYDEQVRQFIQSEMSLCNEHIHVHRESTSPPKIGAKALKSKVKHLNSPKAGTKTMQSAKGREAFESNTKTSVKSVTNNKNAQGTYTYTYPLNMTFDKVLQKLSTQKVGKKAKQIVYDVRLEGTRVTMKTPKKMSAKCHPEPTKKGVYRCEIKNCAFQTTSSPGLTSHLVSMHRLLGSRNFKCSLCKIATIKKYDFLAHCATRRHKDTVTSNLEKKAKQIPAKEKILSVKKKKVPTATLR